MSSFNRLPRILVIDDQYGRCGLGSEFRDAVGPEVFAAFVADRRALCTNFGLVDITGDVRARAQDEPLSEAIFCPAQVWNGSAARIENSAALALEMTRRGWPFPNQSRWALVLLDLRFTFGAVNQFGDPEQGTLFGLEVLLPLLLREVDPELPIVILSSTPREENNARARTLGALDFIQRLPGVGAPPSVCRQALKETIFQHGLIPDPLGWVAGESLEILRTLRQARRASRSADTILIQGETGSGKGLLARYIHKMSERRDGPLEVFNAAQRPPELQADELFGHWKGAFTDAREDSAGLWERADGGTVFIDEVADLDPAVQLRLMQPIEERRVRRLGHAPRGTESERSVDVRVILASNRRLEEQPTIKKDFLNRINALTIEVPSLRERPSDIPELARRILERIAPAWRGRLLPDAIMALQAHEWRQGNVRELRNVLARALANFPDQDITARDLELAVSHAGPPESDTRGIPTAGWSDFIEALRSEPRSWKREEVESWKRQLQGAFLEIVAAALVWSIRATREGGKANYTAAARLLAGQPRMTTMQAKRFLKRVLTLDRSGNRLWTAVAAQLDDESRSFLFRLMDNAVEVEPDIYRES